MKYPDPIPEEDEKMVKTLVAPLAADPPGTLSALHAPPSLNAFHCVAGFVSAGKDFFTHHTKVANTHRDYIRVQPKVEGEVRSEDVTTSQYQLSLGYLFGAKGVKPDALKGFSLVTKANLKKYREADTVVAICYLYGIGATQNGKLAVGMLQRASERKDPIASYYMGLCHHKGYAGIAIDLRAAEHYYKLAASLGMPDCVAAAHKALRELPDFSAPAAPTTSAVPSAASTAASAATAASPSNNQFHCFPF